MGVASPTGIPGGGSRGGFEGSGRAGPAGESPAWEIWKVSCVGRERGAEKPHVAGEAWRARGRKGAVSQAVGLQGQFLSDCSLLPHILSILKGQRASQVAQWKRIHVPMQGDTVGLCLPRV